MNRLLSSRRERRNSLDATYKRPSNSLSLAIGVDGLPPKTQVKQESITTVVSLTSPTHHNNTTTKQNTPKIITRPRAVIESIATGTPAKSREQADVAAKVADMFGPTSPHADRIPRLYAKTRIETRHRAVDPLDDDFDLSMPIRKRMDLFLEHAAPLAVQVAQRAVDKAPSITNPHEDIGLLVLVTSTGFVAPGVDVAVMRGLGLHPTVARVVINFMGCAAAMNGIRTAADYVLARYAETKTPKKALIVCVELSSVNGVFKQDLNDVIISSLFGDGCAALVLAARGDADSLAPGEIALRGSFSRLVEGTADGITLGVNADGITCELSPALPKYIRGAVGGAVEEVLRDHGLTKSAVQLWAIHPGGPKIIEESLASLGLPDEVARTSWEMLGRYGNMLSVSLPFVLQRMAGEAKSARPVSTGVAFSFGPGITVEGVVFDIAGVESTSLSSPSSETDKHQSPVVVLDAGMLADFSALGVCGSHMG